MSDNITLHDYDVADYLRTPAEMADYLDACIEESGGDMRFIAKALGDIARAQGMTDLSRATGLGRESLYKSLSEQGNPGFDTILKVAHALGLRITVTAASG